MTSLRSRIAWRRTPERRDAPAGTLTLGRGDLRSEGIGAKAAMLDTAAAAGLPVPPGFVIPHDAPVPELGSWHETSTGTPVAVRSAFSAEDQDDRSLAGWFETVLNVDPPSFDAAVETVRASAGRHTGRFRHDVLVMDMVDARRSGVAFSEPETYDDRINSTDGTAEQLVGGDVEGTGELLPRLERVADGWRARLQQLLVLVRNTFGDDAWDIEWADDGSTCWLVQIRPITARTRRNEAFTIANHAEILPPLPSQFMTSVIESAGPELFAWYRAFDPTLPADRPFLEVIAGRPFINLTLLEDMLRHWGLPTALVAESIGGPPENPRPARPWRMLTKSRSLMRMGIAQVVAVRNAAQNERALAAAGEANHETFAAAIADLRSAYVGLVTGMFPLSSAIGPPLSILRRTGTLTEHASRHRTITTRMAEAIDRMPREEFLDVYGHRGVYESDVARPRFKDDPTLLGDRSMQAGVLPKSPARTVTGVLTRPIWWLARRPLAAREQLRHEAMRGFSQLRDALVRLADRAVREGRLPTTDHLWLLDSDEATKLDAGWTPDATFWASRLDERSSLAALDPPSIVRRFDDPASWSPDRDDRDVLGGLSLTDGHVSGRAWVLVEPSVTLPEGFDPQTTVLVARSVDAGWIPTFALVAAAVVEIGGDLSHGSILLRERGLPAVTNVRGATKALATGEQVEVRAGSGTIRRLDHQPNEASASTRAGR